MRLHLWQPHNAMACNYLYLAYAHHSLLKEALQHTHVRHDQKHNAVQSWMINDTKLHPKCKWSMQNKLKVQLQPLNFNKIDPWTVSFNILSTVSTGR